MPSILNSDDGVVSGTSGLKTTGGNDGITTFQQNGTEAVRITSAGDVGVGTASPTANTRLDVVSPSNATQFVNVLRLKTSVNGDFHPSILFENNRNLVSNAVKIAMDSGTTAGTSEFRFFTQDSGGTFNLRMRLANNGDFQFNSGYGSTATAFGCRAWVNFNGTGTPAIRGSGNVTSISDNGTGDYTVNFTNAMPDANYSVTCGGTRSDGAQSSILGIISSITAPTSSAVRVQNKDDDGVTKDALFGCIAVFR